MVLVDCTKAFKILTWKFGNLESFLQWAAVSTVSELSKIPPQKGLIGWYIRGVLKNKDKYIIFWETFLTWWAPLARGTPPCPRPPRPRSWCRLAPAHTCRSSSLYNHHHHRYHDLEAIWRTCTEVEEGDIPPQELGTDWQAPESAGSECGPT